MKVTMRLFVLVLMVILVEVEAVVMLVLRTLCRTARMRGCGTAGTCSMTTKLES